MKNLLKMSAIVLGVFAATLNWSEAQAGGRRRGCYYQPTYAAPATTQRYQSAYQAPAAPVQNYYYYNTPSSGYRSGGSLWDKQTEFARKIKGL